MLVVEKRFVSTWSPFIYLPETVIVRSPQPSVEKKSLSEASSIFNLLPKPGFIRETLGNIGRYIMSHACVILASAKTTIDAHRSRAI